MHGDWRHRPRRGRAADRFGDREVERPRASDRAMDNEEIAARLDEMAHLLGEQEADPFRVEAYRRAAASIRTLEEPARDIFARDGMEGLDRIPAVGPVIARAIRELVRTGELPMLERLRGELGRGSVLGTVPGIGPTLARRLEDELGIQTLEQLEIAAHDGTLATLAGFGPKRVRGIREALAGRLGRSRQPPDIANAPPVAELLDVDREYREGAAAGRLRRIAPRRFNPGGEAWLPVLHTRRGDREYTALYSNTALAHRLGATEDWVVIYYDTAEGEGQCTVVTAARGPLAGRRVVRGREAESKALYRTPRGSAPAARTTDRDREPARPTRDAPRPTRRRQP